MPLLYVLALVLAAHCTAALFAGQGAAQAGTLAPPPATAYPPRRDEGDASLPVAAPGAFPYPYLGSAYACQQGGNGSDINLWINRNGSFYYIYNDNAGWPPVLAFQYLNPSAVDPWSNAQYLLQFLVHLACSSRLSTLPFVADTASTTPRPPPVFTVHIRATPATTRPTT